MSKCLVPSCERQALIISEFCWPDTITAYRDAWARIKVAMQVWPDMWARLRVAWSHWWGT